VIRRNRKAFGSLPLVRYSAQVKAHPGVFPLLPGANHAGTNNTIRLKTPENRLFLAYRLRRREPSPGHLMDCPVGSTCGMRPEPGREM
jgi:hypothetical protein